MVKRLDKNEAVPKMGRDTFEICIYIMYIFNELHHLKTLLSRPKNGTAPFHLPHHLWWDFSTHHITRYPILETRNHEF